MLQVLRPIERRLTDREAWLAQRCRVMPMATMGRLSALLSLLGMAGRDGGDDSLELPLWRARTGATLFHEGAHPEHLFVVRSGSFKCVKTSEDGYEQVLAFVGPGEVLGFEALCRDREPVSAVALEEASVYALPLSELNGWRRDHPALDQALQLALSAQLVRAAEMAEMMAAVAAEVRLARFLVWLSSRMAERGWSPHRIRLCMSRREIASLLGVAHETVSRSFTALAQWGHLRVNNREVEIFDPESLKACTRSTRRLADEAASGRRPGRRSAMTLHQQPAAA